MIKVAKPTYVYISVYIYIQIYTDVQVCTRLPDLICLTTLAKGWTVGEKLVQTQEDGTPDRLRVGLLESFCPFGPESWFNPCGKCLSIFVRTSVLFWTFYRLQPGVDRTSYQTAKMCPVIEYPRSVPQVIMDSPGMALEHVFFFILKHQLTNSYFSD